MTEKRSPHDRAAMLIAAAVLISLLAFCPGCGKVNVPNMMRDAATAASAGKWGVALDLTERCLAAEPNNVTAMTFHGLCLLEMRRLDDAVEVLEQAAASSNEFAPQYFYGWVLCESRRYGDALAPLKKAYALSRNQQDTVPDVLCLLARCCLEQNLPDGIKYLQLLRQYRTFKDAPELDNALGIMWLYQGSYDKARKYLLMAWEKDKTNGVVLQNLAILHDHYLRDPAQAMRYYQYSIKASQTANDRSRQGKIQNRLRQMARERMEHAPEGNEIR